MAIWEASAVWLLALPQIVSASSVKQVHYLNKRDVTPHMMYDPNTISTCTYWYDNWEGLSCLDVRTSLDISAETFSRWNPSITLTCDNWQELSYCIEVKSEQTSIISSPSTTTSTSTTSATVRPTPTAWSARGCYLDGDLRTLPDQSSVASGSYLTIASCEAACWAADYNFAGVEFGNDCWCGNIIGNEQAPNSTDCNVACSGDATEICGGLDRINVYQALTASSTTTTTTSVASTSTSLPSQTSDPSKPATWLALGCYAESDSHDLQNQVTVTGGASNTTQQGCIDACDQGGYSYAGVEAGNQCWCDTQIHSPGAPASDGNIGCNTTCAGNSTQICGGTNRLNIFLKADL